MPVSARSGFSAQTLSVLAALCSEPSRWCHGYALARQTRPRPASRIKIGYSVPDFSPVCLASA